MIEEFFVRHDIPVGPVLFLREWGISWTSPLPRKAEDHKQELIRNMLALYSDLPFVLIGDSGQHDPEVYHDIVAENPGRVLAVYIRNVSRQPERVNQIEKLAASPRRGRQQSWFWRRTALRWPSTPSGLVLSLPVHSTRLAARLTLPTLSGIAPEPGLPTVPRSRLRRDR